MLESDLKATNHLNVKDTVNFLYRKHINDKNFIYWINPISKFGLTILSPVPSYLERAQSLEKKFNFS